MKKLLLSIALLLPMSVSAMDKDSVYNWGPWSQGVKPAAGQAMRLTPAPVEKPQINFRPNENAAFSRTVVPVASPAPLPVPTAQPEIIQIPVDQATGDPRNGRG